MMPKYTSGSSTIGDGHQCDADVIPDGNLPPLGGFRRTRWRAAPVMAEAGRAGGALCDVVVVADT